MADLERGVRLEMGRRFLLRVGKARGDPAQRASGSDSQKADATGSPAADAETTQVLRIRVLDQTGKPVNNASCLFSVDQEATATTDEKGVIEIPIAAKHGSDGELSFPDLQTTFHLMILDQLDSIDTPLGQRDRLNNIGYFAGFTRGSDESDPNLQWALEEFQCDELGSRKVTGKPDELTLRKLQAVHGS